MQPGQEPDSVISDSCCMNSCHAICSRTEPSITKKTAPKGAVLKMKLILI